MQPPICRVCDSMMLLEPDPNDGAYEIFNQMNKSGEWDYPLVWRCLRCEPRYLNLFSMRFDSLVDN